MTNSTEMVDGNATQHQPEARLWARWVDHASIRAGQRASDHVRAVAVVVGAEL